MSSGSEDFVMADADDAAEYDMITDADIVTAKNWLNPTDYNGEGSEYNRHLSSHTRGTNAWLLSTPEWQRWHDTADHGFLRLTGIPGSGKSVLAAHLAYNLETAEKVPVLFFFFRQIIDANHTPQALLRDWLCQLLPFSPTLRTEIDPFLRAKRPLSSVSMDDLWRLLHTGLSDQPRAYAIADALDEMDAGNEEFLRALAELGRFRPATVKVLVTGRPIPVIELAFRGTADLHVRLEESYVDVDIVRYVTQRLDDCSIRIEAEDRDRIRSAVPGRANGLFLYARLAMNGFLEPGADIRDVLRRLPADLNCMYTDLLNEHARRSGTPLELQTQILQWVTHASRPLRVLELSEIMDFRSARRDLASAKALVRASCGPLIEVLPDETLSVCHHSLTEFLKGWTRSDSDQQKTPFGPYPILRPGPTHLSLAKDCLRYLAGGCLDVCKLQPEDDEEYSPSHRVLGKPEMYMDFPFSRYAVVNWRVHVSKAVEQGISDTELTSLIDDLDEVLGVEKWRHVLLRMDPSSLVSAGARRLHVAAWAGFEAYVERLLGEGEQVNQRDKYRNTPLHWAVHAGSASVTSLLLARGAESDPDNNVGLKPLHTASSQGHAAVVTLLLQAGVDPMTPKTVENPGRFCGNMPITVGDTPLMYACHHGHTEAVNSYIPFLQQEHKDKAFMWAVLTGKSKVAAILMHQPEFKVNAGIVGDTTALNVACDHLYIDLIHMLLEAGADPNAGHTRKSGRNAPRQKRTLRMRARHSTFTPMHAFASRHRGEAQTGRDPDRHQAILSALDALIKAGGRVDIADDGGRTILHYACSNHGEASSSLRTAMVERLLSAGADASIADEDGLTPLHLCTNDPSGHLIRLLVERGGADLNTPDAQGRVPLMALLSDDRRCASTTLHLIHMKPDCNAVDQNGNTPLHMAVQYQRGSVFMDQEKTDSLNEQIIAALLAAGANPKARNSQEETPLHLLEFQIPLVGGTPDFSIQRRFILMLLEKGADLEAKNNRGETMLFQRIRQGRTSHLKEILQLLIDLGCDIHTQDSAGRGVLHEIVRSDCNADILEFCISRGANRHLRDNQGNNVLHEIAKGTNVQKASSYYDACGVSANERNNLGQTPLLIAGGVAPTNWFSDSPFTKFLEMCEDKNAADNRGVVPIHMACCVNETYVSKLLAAGADLALSTKENLNVLHISARARQSNVLGVLCERILASENKTWAALIDAVDSYGRTPLHYACRSGRPESVDVLLRAGASPHIPDNAGLTAIAACAEFEHENVLWSALKGRQVGMIVCIEEHPSTGDERSLMPAETMNGGLPPARKMLGNEHDTARLGEILDLLSVHGADMNATLDDTQSMLSHAIRYAVQHKLDYTFDCLETVADHLMMGEITDRLSPDIHDSQDRVYASMKAFHESKVPHAHEHSDYYLSNLLFNRKYDNVREVMRLQDRIYVEQGKALFVKWGYADLLEYTMQETGRVSGTTSAEAEAAAMQSGRNYTPLLIAACDRELSNTKVLEVLSRQDDFAIDEQSFKHLYRGNSYEWVHAETALHKLSHGTHWWNVAEGIPFLLDQGANINARDEDQRTPLHVALLQPLSTGLYHEQAAQILIERGADVNAIDGTGRSCLTMTENYEMISLLVKHGARRSSGPLFNAVMKRQPKLLEDLLASGVDPNCRISSGDESSAPVESLNWMYTDHHSRQRALPHAENFVLHYAATRKLTQSFGGPAPDPTIDEELVRALLRHGADPYRTFRKPVAEPESSSGGWRRGRPQLLEVPNVIRGDQATTELTIVHEVLYKAGHFRPFLEMPDLKLEVRDTYGRTLLLAACRQASARCVTVGLSTNDPPMQPCSIATQLIHRGADLSARDNDGNNALHACLKSGAMSFEETVRILVEKAPNLIRETNSQSETPFHLAVRSQHLPVIRLLISSGADVTMPDKDGNSVLHHAAAWLWRQTGFFPHIFGQQEEIDANSVAASAANHAFFQEMLTTSGVDINARNMKGETPFMFFFRTIVAQESARDLETFRPLLRVLRDAGADIFLPDGHGQTPLHALAAIAPPRTLFADRDETTHIPDLFTFLVSLGFDPHAEDEKKRTSLDIAAATENTAILALYEKGR